MSLEDALRANTEALEAHTAFLKTLTPKDTKVEVNNKKTSTDDDEKPAPKKGAKKVKVPSTKEMADAAKEFLAVDDEDEYKDRRNFVKKVIAKVGHDGRFSEIPEAKRAEALEELKGYDSRGEDESDEDDDEI